jgi:hypothetical protein
MKMRTVVLLSVVTLLLVMVGTGTWTAAQPAKAAKSRAITSWFWAIPNRRRRRDRKDRRGTRATPVRRDRPDRRDQKDRRDRPDLLAADCRWRRGDTGGITRTGCWNAANGRSPNP